VRGTAFIGEGSQALAGKPTFHLVLLFQSTLLCFSVNGVFKEGENLLSPEFVMRSLLQRESFLAFLASQLPSGPFSPLTSSHSSPSHLSIAYFLCLCCLKCDKGLGIRQHRLQSQTVSVSILILFYVSVGKLHYLLVLHSLFVSYG
jgi:hypothetical protein